MWGEVDEEGILSKDKVVVFSSPDAFSPLISDHCTALVLFSQGSCMARFSRDRDLGYLDPPDASKFHDIVNFDRCVYAIDQRGLCYSL